MEFSFKDHYNVYDLVSIVHRLRAPDGCPWDKVQTHQTIRKDFIEEVYEAVEAIDENDPVHLREELGDVLLQVVFHCVLESEQNGFTLDDVADDVCKKMILRHPHVFGDVTAETPEDVLRNWDQIKMQTKDQTSASEAMESVSRSLPSLMRCEKLWKKAERGGYSLPDAGAALRLTEEKLSELKELMTAGDAAACESKTGELLFAVVGLSRFACGDCEKSLYDACDDFIRRFRALEAYAAENGIDIQKSGHEEINRILADISNHQNNGGK